MNKAGRASAELRSVEDLTKLDSPVHRLDPLVKLIMTLVFIFMTASFGKYDLAGLVVMVLIPLTGYAISTVSVSECFIKLRHVLPLVVLVGIANIFFDREISTVIGRLSISYGMISFITLALKGILCLMASFLLAATTPIDALCKSLRRIKCPKMFVSLILLTYRYVAVLLDEVSLMTDCYSLRAPGQKGIRISAWGSFLGQLILRSMNKANRAYDSMMLRGFDGEFAYCDKRYAKYSVIVAVMVSALCVILRFYNLPAIIAGAF